MWESPGGQHGMRDAPPPPGFVSSGPSMLPPQGALTPRSQVEATGRRSSSLRPPLSAPAAASCGTHTIGGIHDAPACGFRAGGPDFQAEERGRKPLPQGWSTVYLVYTARTQPWEVRTSLCCRGHGWCEQGGGVTLLPEGNSSPQDSERQRDLRLPPRSRVCVGRDINPHQDGDTCMICLD